MSFYKAVNYIFSPFLVAPFSFFLLVLNISKSPQQAILYSIIFFTLNIAPVLTYISVQKKRGLIKNIHVKNRLQRPKIYMIGMITSLITLAFINTSGLEEIYFNLTIILVLSNLTYYLINRKIKLSIHTALISGLSILFYLIDTNNINISINYLLLTFLVMIARVKTKEHTKEEVVVGFGTGILSVLIIWYLVSLF